MYLVLILSGSDSSRLLIDRILYACILVLHDNSFRFTAAGAWGALARGEHRRGRARRGAVVVIARVPGRQAVVVMRAAAGVRRRYHGVEAARRG